MNSIKITSGKLRGRAISSPNLEITHPMGAREKLALFNMISGYLPNATVLDAYAGSGALGIEALSRGAKRVTFIEKSPKVASVIRKNLNLLELGEFSSVIQCDAKDFSSTHKYNIILVDPPYDNFELAGVENLAKLLDESGILVLSHPDETPEVAGLKLQKSHQYANAHVSVYIKI